MIPMWKVSHSSSQKYQDTANKIEYKHEYTQKVEFKNPDIAIGVYWDEKKWMHNMYDGKLCNKYEIYAVLNMCKSATCAVSVLRSLTVLVILQHRLDNDLQTSMLGEHRDY